MLVFLFAIYLIYKGVEIFQLAYIAGDEIQTRKSGLVIGIIATIIAVLLAGFSIYLMIEMSGAMSNDMPRFPR